MDKTTIDMDVPSLEDDTEYVIFNFDGLRLSTCTKSTVSKMILDWGIGILDKRGYDYPDHPMDFYLRVEERTPGHCKVHLSATLWGTYEESGDGDEWSISACGPLDTEVYVIAREFADHFGDEWYDRWAKGFYDYDITPGWGTPDKCVESPTGKHAPNMLTIQADMSDQEGIVDTTCIHCGRWCSTKINPDDFFFF